MHRVCRKLQVSACTCVSIFELQFSFFWAICGCVCVLTQTCLWYILALNAFFRLFLCTNFSDVCVCVFTRALVRCVAKHAFNRVFVWVAEHKLWCKPCISIDFSADTLIVLDVFQIKSVNIGGNIIGCKAFTALSSCKVNVEEVILTRYKVTSSDVVEDSQVTGNGTLPQIVNISSDVRTVV